MAGLTVGELIGLIRADDSGMRRGLRSAEDRMREFNRYVATNLRDIYERFAAQSLAMGQALADGFTTGVTAARDALRQFARDTRERLQSVGRWFAAHGATMGRSLRDGIGNGVRGALTAVRNMAQDVSWHARIMANNFAHRTRSMWQRYITGSGQAGDGAGRGLAVQMLARFVSTFRAGIGAAFTSAMTGLRSVSSSVGSNPVAGLIAMALATAVAAAFAPALGALLGGIVISVSGIGIIGLGAALLKDEPAVKKAAEQLAGTVKGIFKTAAQPMVDPMARALAGLEQTAKDVAPKIREAFRNLVDSGAIGRLQEGIDGLVKRSLPGFSSMLKNSAPVWEGLRVLLERVGSGLGKMFSAIGTKSPEMGQALKDLGTIIENTLFMLGVFIAYLAGLYGKVRPYLAKVVGAFQWMYDVLVGHSIVPDMVNAIVDWFTQLPGRAGRALASLPGTIFRIVNDAGARMRAAISSLLDSASRLLAGLPGRARRALGNLGGTLYGAGQSIVRGLINGINSMLGSLHAAAQRAANAVTSTVKGALGIHSPSRVMAEVGANIVQGMSMGMAATMPSLQRQVAGMSLGIPETAMGSKSGASATAGGPQRVVIELRGPESMRDLIRSIVQTDGRGDVQVTFGQR